MSVVSSTNKDDRHEIAKILLSVTVNMIAWYFFVFFPVLLESQQKFKVSEWILLNAKWAIFQLCHGKNKLFKEYLKLLNRLYDITWFGSVYA